MREIIFNNSKSKSFSQVVHQTIIKTEIDILEIISEFLIRDLMAGNYYSRTFRCRLNDSRLKNNLIRTSDLF